MTATPDKGQAQRISHVFKQFIGPIVPGDDVVAKYISDNSNKGNVIVNILRYQVHSDEYSEHLMMASEKPNVAGMITNINNNPDRNNMLIHYIKAILDNDSSRKILVVSDRIDQLRYIHSKLKQESGLFIGGLGPSEIDEVKQKQVILGTYPCVDEGLSIKELNTLIIATPRRDSEQTVGRILRQLHDIPALIVDVIDLFSPTFSNQGTARKRYYKTCDYQIHDHRIKDINNLPDLEYDICANLNN